MFVANALQQCGPTINGTSGQACLVGRREFLQWSFNCDSERPPDGNQPHLNYKQQL